MPHARREPRFIARYQVQDALDMVLNGESDVDIDFTETDEESDEEACGEESKENQPPSEPTDCPGDADIQIHVILIKSQFLKIWLTLILLFIMYTVMRPNIYNVYCSEAK